MTFKNERGRKMKRVFCWLLILTMILTTIPAMADSKANVKTSGDYQYTVTGNGKATIVGYTGEEGKDIIIPQMLDGYTVGAIGDNAFKNDRYDEVYDSKPDPIRVTIPETVKTIGEFAFWGRNIMSINLPDGLEEIGQGAFVSCNDITYRISSSHPVFAVIDGALYNKQKKELVYGKEGATIPEGIVSIGNYACYAVDNCGITDEDYSPCFVLPLSIKKIGDYAFAYNSYFGDSTIGFAKITWNNPNLIEIGDYAFFHTGFRDAIIFGGCMKITLPDSVKQIGTACFESCAGDIIIGKNSSLREIPERAFARQYDSYGALIVSCDAPIATIGKEAFSNATISGLNMKNIITLEESAFKNARFFDDIEIPSECKTVSRSAFANCSFPDGAYFKIVINNGVQIIESGAFANVETEMPIQLPANLTKIAQDAFPKETAFTVEKGSYAQRWAEENAYTYTINGEQQNLDWLNN